MSREQHPDHRDQGEQDRGEQDQGEQDPRARARLRVRLVQTASSLEPADNREALAGHVAAAAAAAGEASMPTLVVLPEAYARDFGPPDSDLAAYAEPFDGPFVTALTGAAQQHGVSVLAGMFRTPDRDDQPDEQGGEQSGEQGGALPYNTLVLRGDVEASYDKIHLYDSFGYKESDRLLAGDWEPVVVELGGFRVGLMTCYDLRFPELARALVDAGAEVIVVPSAWVAGDRKVDHWRTLVTARAIENTVWMVAVGQPAPRYSGHSMVVSPHGDVLAEAGDGEETLDVVLDGGTVVTARDVNPSLTNRRG